MTPNTAPAAGAAPAMRRFTDGALNRLEGPFYDQSIVPGAAAQTFPLMQIPTGGWEREIHLIVSCDTAGNAAATAFQPDAPWSALQEITFRDARGNTVIGPLTGWDLFIANKWLGYQYQTDYSTSPVYSVTTGVGAGLGGSFKFILPIPLELIGRDAIGSLANGASNTALRVQITLAPSTSIYSTAPTALAAVRIRAFHEAWQQPDGAAFAGSPVGAGTFHQLTKQNYPYVASENRIDLSRKGNPQRGMILVFRTAANVRTATSALLGLNPVQFLYEGSDLISASEDLVRFRMWRANNNGATIDTGVLVVDPGWISDFDGKAGSELREQWLRSQPGSRLELRFTAGAAGTLDVITDEVVPAGDLVYVP